jgi:hypothetical protein
VQSAGAVRIVTSVREHLQTWHGMDVEAEWRYAPDSWRRNVMSAEMLELRHTELHEDDVWNEASERHVHPWYEDLTKLLEASAFECYYAKNSGIMVRQLHQWGRFVEPCDCGEDGCIGWAMGHQWEDAIVEGQERMGS